MNSFPPGRYLVLRRVVQMTVLALLVAGYRLHWPVLTGDLSFSRLLGRLPLADPLATLQLTLAQGPPARDVLLGAAVTLLFYSLVAGRAFCAWVCPVNMVTDLANRWGGRLHDRTGGPGARTRYGILALSLVLSGLLGVAAFEAVSPVAALHRGVVYGMTTGWLVILAVFLYDLAIQRNGFCGHLCPLGALYTLAARFRLLHVIHDHHACSDCGHCRTVCPEPTVLALVGEASGAITAPACTNCGRCLEVCPDAALRFGTRRPVRRTSPGGP